MSTNRPIHALHCQLCGDAIAFFPGQQPIERLAPLAEFALCYLCAVTFTHTVRIFAPRAVHLPSFYDLCELSTARGVNYNTAIRAQLRGLFNADVQ